MEKTRRKIPTKEEIITFRTSTKVKKWLEENALREEITVSNLVHKYLKEIAEKGA
ncbi:MULTISPECIES: hypothetical protein [Ureibacillus]|uniref:hypothetical protein n=1 Tax=Ureibacillus TaxID=160795 RepID=UPI0002DC35B1|nr:hypothetical protein [Ureibacillus thermosphaericus]